MRVVPTALPEVIVIEPDVHADARGFFLETYHVAKYRELGVSGPFLQDNYSRSTLGTIRGLHLQVERPQGKLIRVVSGEIFDVAVDVRRGSPTFGRWVGLTLTGDTNKQCYIPPGFAHGFSVLSEIADVEYKCTDVYDPAAEIGIAWNDPELAIPWGVEHPVLSDRDRAHPRLSQIVHRLPEYAATNL